MASGKLLLPRGFSESVATLSLQNCIGRCRNFAGVFGNLNFLEDGIFYSGGTIAVNLNALDFSPVSEFLVGTGLVFHYRCHRDTCDAVEGSVGEDGASRRSQDNLVTESIVRTGIIPFFQSASGRREISLAGPFSF